MSCRRYDDKAFHTRGGPTAEKLQSLKLLCVRAGRLKASSPTMTLPCPSSCRSSGAVRTPSPSAMSDAALEALTSRSDAGLDPADGGTSTCCRGLPHVERDRAVSTVARRATAGAAHLPPPPPPRRSDWTAWTTPSAVDDGCEPPGRRSGELTSTV